MTLQFAPLGKLPLKHRDTLAETGGFKLRCFQIRRICTPHNRPRMAPEQKAHNTAEDEQQPRDNKRNRNGHLTSPNQRLPSGPGHFVQVMFDPNVIGWSGKANSTAAWWLGRSDRASRAGGRPALRIGRLDAAAFDGVAL